MAAGRRLAAHLYRRAGFGALPHELDALERSSFSDLVTNLLSGLTARDRAGDAVRLPHLTPVPQACDSPNAYAKREHGELVGLTNWWVTRMMVSDTPLREKLTLLLHEQFPTAYEKVRFVELMYRQNSIFRSLGPGRFDTLTKAIAQDPAMLRWLDADLSVKANPNLNFARELMERFTMGVGNYTEADVSEAGRAFTGWAIDYTTGLSYLDAAKHDDGIKRVLGHSGKLSGDDVVEIVTHSAASPRWVASRLWSWLGYPATPNDDVVSELARVYARDLDMRALLEAIFRHPAFSTRSIHALIKQPVEFIVGTLRCLGLTVASFGSDHVQVWLSDLGQELFAPPNVGGWGGTTYWISTAESSQQLNFAYEAASRADLSHIAELTGHPAQQVAAVQRMLAIDSFSPRTMAALLHVAGAKGSETARNLVVLALVSPEYLLN